MYIDFGSTKKCFTIYFKNSTNFSNLDDLLPIIFYIGDVTDMIMTENNYEKKNQF